MIQYISHLALQKLCRRFVTANYRQPINQSSKLGSTSDLRAVPAVTYKSLDCT